MKGRSHRLPSSDPPEDWVDGSWTVDCVCGVNFDDGEEMVNCDECGVWVHTRCSRYVKGEKLFACDKCKSKNNRNDSEETEVAQLLVELPTKTMRMESSYGSNIPARRPFRLWTDIPIEERVHVQGIPGGEPGLFEGLSSVFTPELWKCTGYVPKKFNFQYREFPCWDEKEEADSKIEEENENPVDKGAGVLFSLSKEAVLAAPAALVNMRGQTEEGGFDRKPATKELKTWEAGDSDVRPAQNGVKKERSLLRPFVVHPSKRKKEDFGPSKDRSGKKRIRTAEKEDTKKRGSHSSKTGFTSSSDAKQLEYHEDRSSKLPKTNNQSNNKGNLRGTLPTEPASDVFHVVDSNVDKSNDSLVAAEHDSESFPTDASRHDFPIGAGLDEDKTEHQVPARSESSPKTDIVSSTLENNTVESVPMKEEVVNMAAANLDDNGGSYKNMEIDVQKSNPPFEEVPSVASNLKESQVLLDSNGDMLLNSVKPDLKVKADVDDDNSGRILDSQSSALVDVKPIGTEHLSQIPGISADQMSENSKLNDLVALSFSQCSDHKAQDVDKSAEVASDPHADKADQLSGGTRLHKQELDVSDGSMIVQKSTSEPKHGSKLAEEPPKLDGTVFSSQALSSQRKMVVCVGKSSPSSSTVVISKSSVSDNCKPMNTQNSNPIAKERIVSNCNTNSKKDHAASDVVRDEDRHEMPRKTVKERPKSSINPALKASHSNRIPHSSVSKRPLSDSKDPVLHSSSKAPSAQNTAVPSGSGDSAGSLQTQSAVLVQNKVPAPSLSQRGEKFSTSNSQSSSKVNNMSSMHPTAPSNSPATLSDEELALLLHQELNSSPRVPRVPRVRHAGSLPQLTSPTGTSMLIKRTSSSGGKDHGLIPRRKSKDISKDGSRGFRERDDEAKKMDRVPSPDQRRHDPVHAADASTKREADDGFPKAEHSVKKNIPLASNTTANSGPSSSNEVNDQNLASVRNSPRNMSDDDAGTVRVPAHRTLPGLINDIMSKGRRMTYEELCNAVLPHWHNLRKHNGERYAYSSHSQAVLDCLRNRNEWARLIDRGPKTNASRKRRKLDAEPSSFELDDNEYGKGKMAKEVESKSLESHREEFPKGKRKARRRRLALQGRGIKDVRKRRKAAIISDDDIEPFSNSSDESIFSEDEIQGGGTGPVGSEASASSDEVGTRL